MGQYYYVVNLDKKQYIKPHECNDGAKLMELHTSLTLLSILCSSGNGRGGGDCRSENPIIGTWAGDRIVVAGDYDDEDKFPEAEKEINFVPGAPADPSLPPDDAQLFAVTIGDDDEDDVGGNLYNRCAGGAYENITAKAMEALKEDGRR